MNGLAVSHLTVNGLQKKSTVKGKIQNSISSKAFIIL